MNVVFCIYNRPDLTARVFERIAAAKPDRLLLVADGPRREVDIEPCRKTRSVVERIDWPCEVLRNYSDTNLGCKRRISSGLDWAFSEVEEAIVLEDDTLPHPDFFRFCAEMLDRYRDDTRVSHICGANFDHGLNPTPFSYFFSIYTSIWGWATWRRAWCHCYDVSMTRWPALRTVQWHYDVFPTEKEARFFENMWTALHEGRIDTWDGQWLFASLVNHMLAVRPVANLVSNIGFGENIEATHTTFSHEVGTVPAEGLSFPLKHPSGMTVNRQSDMHFAELFFQPVNPLWRDFKSCILNRHWYGKRIRRLPLVGSLWARLRSKRRANVLDR